MLEDRKIADLKCPLFSIIIVTYNSEIFIKNCLDSVYNQDSSDYEIILIDNSSTDRTVDIIMPFRDRIRLEINERNKGFSSAVNKGIGLSKGKYILTLNPDVVLRANFLSEVTRNIKALGREIGMLGVKILKIGEGEIIDSTGLVLSRAIRFFDRGSGEKDIGQYDNQREILGPCAATGIYKREMLEDIKINGDYLDRDFFYLLEDFDIALRAKRKGWQSRYVPEAVCYHWRNGSKKDDNYRQYLSFRNRYLVLIKNIKIKPYLLIYFLIYDIPRWIFILIFNRYRLRAMKELKELYPVMLKKRKKELKYDGIR